MTLRDVRVGEEHWSTAAELRRVEWRTLIADLLDEGPLLAPSGATRMVISTASRALHIVFHHEDREVARALVDDEALRAILDEYVAVIRRMAGDLHPAQLEALDMAKRVVHDKGARTLAALAPLEGAHEQHRRLFSLVVSVWVDTTALPAAHRHRQ